MTAVAAATALYVYGVVPADTDLAAENDAPGVGREPVELVAAGDLAAIVSRVSLDEFGDEALRANLERRDWLEEKARAHDDVLSRSPGVPLVPLRFGAVYLSEDGVRGTLCERADELHDAIERLRGRVELGVKAFARESADASEPAAGGRDYLLRKRRARDEAAAAVEAARAVHERLASLADDARSNPPQRPELSGRREPMLLNGAYLVRVEQETDFAAAVDGLRDEALELVLTGPWPPYNFARAGDDR